MATDETIEAGASDSLNGHEGLSGSRRRRAARA